MTAETGISSGSGEGFHVPWTVRDTWLGLALFVALTVGIIAAVIFWRDASFKVIRSGSANVVKAVRGSDRKFGGVLQASRLL